MPYAIPTYIGNDENLCKGKPTQTKKKYSSLMLTSLALAVWALSVFCLSEISSYNSFKVLNLIIVMAVCKTYIKESRVSIENGIKNLPIGSSILFCRTYFWMVQILLRGKNYNWTDMLIFIVILCIESGS